MSLEYPILSRNAGAEDWLFHRLTRPLKRFLHPRRLHGYCVGTDRSGTTSISKVFSRYRSVHEPSPLPQVRMFNAHAAGKISHEQLRRFMLRRDRLLHAEFESSNLLVHALDIIASCFPKAKFLAGIRDCYSWLDSIVSLRTSLPAGEVGLTGDWERFNARRYRADLYPATRYDRTFARIGLVSLEGCLAYWRWHYETVLATLPHDRRLLFRTVDIEKSIGAFAAFFDIPKERLTGTPVHAGRRKRDAGIVKCIDRAFLEDMVDKHCRSLMDSWYPGMRAADAL